MYVYVRGVFTLDVEIYLLLLLDISYCWESRGEPTFWYAYQQRQIQKYWIMGAPSIYIN